MFRELERKLIQQVSQLPTTQSQVNVGHVIRVIKKSIREVRK